MISKDLEAQFCRSPLSFVDYVVSELLAEEIRLQPYSEKEFFLLQILMY